MSPSEPSVPFGVTYARNDPTAIYQFVGMNHAHKESDDGLDHAFGARRNFAPYRQECAMEKLFKRILCPIDFDENSYFALDLARDLGQEHNATIYLLHVVSIAPVPAAGVPMEPYPVSEHDARVRLEQIAHEHLEDKINYRIITRVGNPADSVNRAVDELQADSIVMATHGRKGIARLLLGSVAEKVVREASCPVLAVKAPAQ